MSNKIQFTVYTASTGKITGAGEVFEGTDLSFHAVNGAAVLEGVAGDYRTQQVDITATPRVLIPIVASTPLLSELKAAAKQAAAERRWSIEIGGVPVGGSVIATDDRSKLLLSNAAEKARADSSFTAKWKTASSTWVVLDAPTILVLYAAVFSWVDACFAREAALDDLIDAATDEAALSALTPTIAAFWP